jgi:pimeloyl-ACP methyl ester carboxylesterase
MAQSRTPHRQSSEAIHYIDAGDCRLRTQFLEARQQPPKGYPTLIFLHEGLGCIELWRDFPQRLCHMTGCQGIVYDRKGYGTTGPCFNKWPIDYLVQEATVYLPQIFSACNIEKAFLIGHSDGGSIALIAAATMGSKIMGIATESAHVFVEDITLAGIKSAVESYHEENLKEKLFKYHGTCTDAVFYRWSNTWLDPEFSHWNIEEFLPNISCPSLILQGENDEYATRDQLESIRTQISGPVVAELLPNCAHTPHFQDKERVIEIMCHFIRRAIKMV